MAWYDEIIDFIDEIIETTTEIVEVIDSEIVEPIVDVVGDIVDWTDENIIEPMEEFVKWVKKHEEDIEWVIIIVGTIWRIFTGGGDEEKQPDPDKPFGEDDTIIVKGPDSGDTTLSFRFQGTPKASIPAMNNDSFLQYAFKPASESQLNQPGLKFNYEDETMLVITSDNRLYVKGVALKE